MGTPATRRQRHVHDDGAVVAMEQDGQRFSSFAGLRPPLDRRAAPDEPQFMPATFARAYHRIRIRFTPSR